METSTNMIVNRMLEREVKRWSEKDPMPIFSALLLGKVQALDGVKVYVLPRPEKNVKYVSPVIAWAYPAEDK